MKNIISEGILLSLFFLFPPLTGNAQITGESNPITDIAYGYEFATPFQMVGATWSVDGGIIDAVFPYSRGKYGVRVIFTDSGPGYVRLSYTSGYTQKDVTISFPPPPNAPPSPSVSTNMCGTKTLTRGTPPSGQVWYWQTSEFGVAKTNSSLTYPVSSSTTIYLRALQGTNNWGPSTATVVTVKSGATAGTLSGAADFYGTAQGTLMLSGHDGNVLQWEQYLPTGGWTAISNSTGQTSYNYTGLTETRQYRVAIGGSGCTTVYTSPVTVRRIPELTGELNPNTYNSHEYSFQYLSQQPDITWEVSSYGTKHIYPEVNGLYKIALTFSTTGSSVIKLKSGSTIIAQRNVTIVAPPAQPPAPTVSSNLCGPKTLTRAESPTNVTYYWQTSQFGTETNDSNQNYVTSSEGTIYLRPLSGSSNWGPSIATVVTIKSGVTAGTVSDAADFYGTAQGTLMLSGHDGDILQWEQYFASGGWTAISNTTGQTSYNYTGLTETRDYRVAIGGSGCTTVYTSPVTVRRIPELTGELNPNTYNSYEYSFQYLSQQSGITWEVSSYGTNHIYPEVNGLYRIALTFSATGSSVIKLKSGSTIIAQRNVTIVAPPAQPPAPTVSTNLCGPKTLTRAEPPTSVTYYWQTSQFGTETIDSNENYVTSSGGTIYLRPLSGSSNWGPPSSAFVTIVSGVDRGSVDGANDYYYNTAQGTLTWQGSPGEVQFWQSKAEEGSWQNISNTASSSYNFSAITENTDYRAAIGGSGCDIVYSPSVSIKVFHHNFEGKIAGTEKLIGTTDSGELELQGCTGTVLEWQSSPDGAHWTTITNSSLSQVLTDLTVSQYYRVRVKKGPNIVFTQPHFVSWHSSNTINPSAERYVTKETMKVEVQSYNVIPGLTPHEKTKTLTYLDGFGRAVQSVTKHASPSQKDIVGFAEYDALGRKTKHYLPYTDSGSDYYSDPATDQELFYNGSTSKVKGDTHPFSTSLHEHSPLQRLVEQGAAGADWQPGGGHTVTNSWRTNLANETRVWKIDGTSAGYYGAGTLYVQETVDENGNKVVTYNDNNGNLLEKHVQETQAGWIRTLYIYDELGRPFIILQPEGVRLLSTSTTISSTLLEQFSFQYTYDARGRLIEKKVPGAGSEFYVYDPLDLLILTQGENLRGNNQWLYVKYDGKGRPIIKGLYSDSQNTTRASVQELVDGLNYSATNPHYEDRSASDPSGYTNRTFPTNNAEILTINFYDDHDFDRNGTPDQVYTSQNLADEGVPYSAEGRLTGSKIRILDSPDWLINYMFYDKYGRVIQIRGNNYLNLSPEDLSTMVYSFGGLLLTSKKFHTARTGKETTIVNRYEYDHSGRVLQISQNNNQASVDQLVVEYEYNELGQVVDKKLHGDGTGQFLQSVDYRYNLRGWLTSINNAKLSSDAINDDLDSQPDFFGMELLHNVSESGLGNTKFYSGNISAIKWKGPGIEEGHDGQRSYTYTYDKADRLTAASFLQRGETLWSEAPETVSESMVYDHNGNITNIQRYREAKNWNALELTRTVELMDNLQYAYSGNLLTAVEDASGNTAGFNNAKSVSDEYTYNSSGSLITDQNKGLTAIIYNILGKPSEIKFGSRKVQYTYSASGDKLSMKVYEGTTLQRTMDYASGFVYENGNLSFFGSPEGRVVKDGNALEYQYAIADHQGNTRVVMSSKPVVPEIYTATFEDPVTDDLEFENIPDEQPYWDTFTAANHTPSGSKVARMNQNFSVGPGKGLRVYPGDEVDLSVWTYYEGSTGFGTTASPLNTLITNVALAFGGEMGGQGESGAIYSGVEEAFVVFGSGGSQGDSQPGAYLNFILFDAQFQLLDAGWEAVPASAFFAKQQISIPTKHITEPGFMFIYLSYESESNNYVQFDDFEIKHTKTPVIQYNEYYPFGLQTASSWTRENHANDYLYNGGSELNATTGWIETPFRDYDPVLGRFHQVDPMTAKYASWTPYNYSLNDPALWNDPSGAEVSYASVEEVARMLRRWARRPPQKVLANDRSGNSSGGWGPGAIFMYGRMMNPRNIYGQREWAGSDLQYAMYKETLSAQNSLVWSKYGGKEVTRGQWLKLGGKEGVFADSYYPGAWELQAQQDDPALKFWFVSDEGLAYKWMLALQTTQKKEIVGVLSVDQSGVTGVLVLPWFSNQIDKSNPSKGYYKTFYEDHNGRRYTPLAIIHTHQENDVQPSPDDFRAVQTYSPLPMYILTDQFYRSYYPTSNVRGNTYDLIKELNPTSLGPK